MFRLAWKWPTTPIYSMDVINFRHGRLRGPRQIKADPNLKATPVIAVSSFAMKGMRKKRVHLAATTT
jgi:hypothetical protein